MGVVSVSCQAVALDTAVMGKPSDLPPCNGMGEVEVSGFLLCPDCAMTIEFLAGPVARAILERVKQANRETFDAKAKAKDGTPTSNDLTKWLEEGS